MGANDVLNVDDKIILLNPNKTGVGPANHYSTHIFSVKDDEYLEIYMPKEAGKLVPVEIGTKFRIIFYTNTGIFQSMCVVSDRYRFGKLFILLIRCTTEIERVQRRQYFRVSCLMDIFYRYNDENKAFYLDLLDKMEAPNAEDEAYYNKMIEESPSDWKAATATDISGGGIRFNCREKIRTNTRIDVKLKIPEVNGNEPIVISSRVISSATTLNRKSMYECRVEYSAIDAKSRENLIKYVFNEDRKNRKKTGGR